MPPKKKTSAPKKSKKWTRTQLKTKALPISSVMAPMHPTSAVENDLPFLGHARSVVIVTTAAGTDASNLPPFAVSIGP